MLFLIMSVTTANNGILRSFHTNNIFNLKPPLTIWYYNIQLPMTMRKLENTNWHGLALLLNTIFFNWWSVFATANFLVIRKHFWMKSRVQNGSDTSVTKHLALLARLINHKPHVSHSKAFFHFPFGPLLIQILSRLRWALLLNAIITRGETLCWVRAQTLLEKSLSSARFCDSSLSSSRTVLDFYIGHASRVLALISTAATTKTRKLGRSSAAAAPNRIGRAAGDTQKQECARSRNANLQRVESRRSHCLVKSNNGARRSGSFAMAN